MTAIRLTDLQLVLLSAAAARPDLMLLPPPDGVRARGRALANTLAKLLVKALVEEVPARHEAESWREAEDGVPIGLRLAAAGREALGVGEDGEAESEDSGADAGAIAPADGAAPAGDDAPDPAQANVAPRLRPGTKQARLVEMLSQPEGAGIATVSRALGWQVHIARAAITGLRRKGFAVKTHKAEDGRTVYHIPAEADADAA